MGFKEFLNESKKIDYMELEYGSGAPKWLVKELDKGNNVISIDINDNEDYAFIRKDGDKYFMNKDGKDMELSFKQAESKIIRYGLGIHYFK